MDFWQQLTAVDSLQGLLLIFLAWANADKGKRIAVLEQRLKPRDAGTP